MTALSFMGCAPFIERKNMTFVELFGFVAAFLTSASFLPQAIMVIRTRQTDGLSLIMYSMFTLGVAMWLGYGLFTRAWPLVIANSVTLLFAGTILSIVIQNKIRRSRIHLA